MAFKHGKSAALTVNAVALGSFCDNLELSRDVDTAETSVFGVDDKTHLAGLRGGELSVSGIYDPTVTTGPGAVFEGLLGGAAVTVIFEPGGNTTGQRRHTFSALITGYTETASVSDVIKFSADVLVTGAVTSITI